MNNSGKTVHPSTAVKVERGDLCRCPMVFATPNAVKGGRLLAPAGRTMQHLEEQISRYDTERMQNQRAFTRTKVL